jgi:hypothetical protein
MGAKQGRRSQVRIFRPDLLEIGEEVRDIVPHRSLDGIASARKSYVILIERYISGRIRDP